MGRKIAIVETHAHQVLTKQHEVFGFFLGNAHPIGIEIIGHGRKTPHGVERQINRVQFDVCNRVHQ